MKLSLHFKLKLVTASGRDNKWAQAYWSVSPQPKGSMDRGPWEHSAITDGIPSGCCRVDYPLAEPSCCVQSAPDLEQGGMLSSQLVPASVFSAAKQGGCGLEPQLA